MKSTREKETQILNQAKILARKRNELGEEIHNLVQLRAKLDLEVKSLESKAKALATERILGERESEELRELIAKRYGAIGLQAFKQLEQSS